jgi:hypothetical protein
MISPCCGAPVRVEGGGIDRDNFEGETFYYVCTKCLMPCDPVEGEEE